MATLPELALLNTTIDGDDLAHLQRLVGSWRMLADLCFTDLLLLAPVAGEEGHRFVVLAQVRPTTGQTMYPVDMVGTVVDEIERPLVTRGWRLAEIVEGDASVLGGKERARLQCIPVRHNGKLLALVTRETATTTGRRHGELERYYIETFERFARMIAEGSFPFGRDEVVFEDTPRVGDGVMVLDAESRIRFASPNAVSSLHRMGIHAYTTGLRLSELGFEETAVTNAAVAMLPVTEEIERGETSILMRVIPLLDRSQCVGVVILLRDVTDLRRRDRLL
ncbi:MAG TPA: histidine kinase N-terminal domain-containing protein, partial [Acidimicrobiia bacterium]|nr:histidine kinase N-terminal domain-containing protein [Acidimicrobiia bacterium]